ncbi:MAG: MarR family transcriptional regulator [Methanomassiliicoccus sp.]|nr:MarR family transcriptional regulator [Methanomassiliicoccus sp.]
MEYDGKNDSLGDLAGVILRTVPLLFRRVIRKDELLDGSPAAYPKIGVLVVLKNEGPLPLSVIAERLSCSRQNLTTLTDRLEAEGLVKRSPGIKDRRVVNLDLTEAGRQCIKNTGERMRQRLIKELENMEDSDIEDLRSSFEIIERTFLKVAAHSGPDDHCSLGSR